MFIHFGRQDGSDPAAHAMHAPDVQGIVEAELLDELTASVAEEGGHEAINEPRRPKDGWLQAMSERFRMNHMLFSLENR